MSSFASRLWWSFAALLLSVAAIAIPSPAGALAAVKVGVEVPVTATDLGISAAYNSPEVALDPTNSRFAVMAYRVDAPPYGCGLEVSGNGGQGWVGADPVPDLPAGSEHCYAPEVVFGPDGTLYYLFLGLHGAGFAPSGAYLTTSRNHARTFTKPWQVLPEENYQVRLAIDPGIGKKGRLYLVWLHTTVAPPTGGLANAPNPIMAAYSDDGGKTFTSPVQVSDPSRVRAVAPAVVVGQDNAVHIAYYDLRDDSRDYQGLDGPVWTDAWSLVMTTSTDRGRGFGSGIVVDDRISPPGRVMLIYTMPPPAVATGPPGRVYIAWPDARSGDADILVARSADGGRNWRPAIRVNDNRPGDHSTHELPRLSVAPNGRVDAVFLDRRNDPENLKADVYYTSSNDSGTTFTPNVRVTSESSDRRIGQGYQIPSAVGLTEYGSRLALLSTRDGALACWPDTRNSSIGSNEQDLFLAKVTVGGDAERSTGWARDGSVAAASVVVLGVVGFGVRRRRARRPKVEAA